MPWSRSRPGGQRARAKYVTPEHKAARKALLERWVPGDLCCLCGKPTWPPTSSLHADHDPLTGGYRGLAHAACNVRDGARRGRERQNTSRLWW